MLLTEPEVDEAAFTARTGWKFEERGACKGDQCIPLPASARTTSGRFSVVGLADAMALPLEHDADHGLWALGPEGGGRALSTVEVPELTLPDLVTGKDFALSSLRGRKVIMVAWASW